MWASVSNAAPAGGCFHHVSDQPTVLPFLRVCEAPPVGSFQQLHRAVQTRMEPGVQRHGPASGDGPVPPGGQDVADRAAGLPLSVAAGPRVLVVLGERDGPAGGGNPHTRTSAYATTTGSPTATTFRGKFGAAHKTTPSGGTNAWAGKDRPESGR